LSAPVTIDGHETAYRVTSFEKTLLVQVTAADSALDLMTWVKEYWVLTAAASSAVVAAITWWIRRRSKRRPPGF
jgi:hypothetical protein